MADDQDTVTISREMLARWLALMEEWENRTLAEIEAQRGVPVEITEMRRCLEAWT